jgi:hypothetical protein
MISHPTTPGPHRPPETLACPSRHRLPPSPDGSQPAPPARDPSCPSGHRLSETPACPSWHRPPEPRHVPAHTLCAGTSQVHTGRPEPRCIPAHAANPNAASQARAVTHRWHSQCREVKGVPPRITPMRYPTADPGRTACRICLINADIVHLSGVVPCARTSGLRGGLPQPLREGGQFAGRFRLWCTAVCGGLRRR